MSMKEGLQKLAHLGLRVFLKLHCGYLVRGQVRLDRPSILVANHASHIDIAAIFAALPIHEVPRVRTAAARDTIYAMPLPIVKAVEFMFGTYPFERYEGSTASLDKGAEFLRQGYHLALFPEGKRNDGTFLGCTPGFAKIAYQTGAPVVPLRIEGANHALPKGSLVVQRRPMEVNFRKPIQADQSVPSDGRRDAYARLCRETESELCV